ncbi:MAG TPA: aldehyde dehydrogenase family protein, partial [Hyphomicrobiales bacterium]|nr:aldehyde dehydrogenase family protein [Hyphomicrobiales bacterium]
MDKRTDIEVPTRLYIGGEWRDAADGEEFDVIEPATEEKITSVASAGIEDGMAALDAAQAAFADWAGRSPRERAEVLRRAY